MTTTQDNSHLPEMIRISIGSALAIGLVQGSLDALPTTTYLLTHRKDKCTANCGFCPQARNSRSHADMLSRVTWPAFSTSQVVNAIGNAVRQHTIKRVCIQALNYPTVFDDVLHVVLAIRSKAEVPMSVSCQPFDEEKMKKLAKAGVERIGIPLDAATPEIFRRIKGQDAVGPYVWERHLLTLRRAVGVFGEGKVSTHLIVGLGETEKAMTVTIQRCVDMGVLPSLFAFTPIPGTSLERSSPPSLSRYRRVQLARFLIVHKKVRSENMRFDADGRIVDFGVAKDVLDESVHSGIPFVTSGCPDCNRPYYNEKPGGPLYNYPFAPSKKDVAEIEETF